MIGHNAESYDAHLVLGRSQIEQATKLAITVVATEDRKASIRPVQNMVGRASNDVSS